MVLHAFQDLADLRTLNPKEKWPDLAQHSSKHPESAHQWSVHQEARTEENAKDEMHQKTLSRCLGYVSFGGGEHRKALAINHPQCNIVYRITIVSPEESSSTGKD